MQLTPSLNFNGDCREAFEFYARCFGGTVSTLLTYAESPMSGMVSAAEADNILHAHLDAPGFTLIGSDHPAAHPSTPSASNALHLTVESADAVDSLLAALGEGGTVLMPPQKTFWAERFGMVADRWGHRWMAGTFDRPS